MTDHNIPQRTEDRRKTQRQNDIFFRTIIGVNVFGWVVFLAALVVFHYARPEIAYGMQEFWGVEGRREWSESLSLYLMILLVCCMLLSLVVLILKRQRNRRTRDHYGANGFVLLFVALGSLLALYLELS